MIKHQKIKSRAVFFAFLLIGSFISMPVLGMLSPNINQKSENQENIVIWEPLNTWDYPEEAPNRLDEPYQIQQTSISSGSHCDIGYNSDAGDGIRQAFPVYIGEPVEETYPGNGRTGTLDSTNRDPSDWYTFTACEGQSFQASVTGGFNYEFSDTEGESTGQTLTADMTGRYFFHVFTEDGSGEYTFDISISGQNDAGIGSDAGDDINSATSISPGNYFGYMSSNDVEDWYSIEVTTGQGIFIEIDPLSQSDYDIHLYNPSGIKVHSEQFYGEDRLEYPADTSGSWKIQFDMFPGWDESKWPENYFLYGSGPYEFSVEIGGNADLPPGPIPQPDITPIAQTFIINDDPTSNKDEYGYLAAVPAANYIENGKRYVSPIIYRGIDDLTHWFGTIDDTTQYLLDDWNTYLERHDLSANEFILPEDPITAASEIAQNNWDSSDTAVIVCDGSDFSDEIISVIDETVRLSSNPEITRVKPGGFQEFGTELAKIMYIGNEYGAIHLIAKGESFGGDTALVTSRYERVHDDDWPSPYDVNGPDMDTWYPIVKSGIWIPVVTSDSGLEELEIIKYKCDRYTIPINEDSSIEVTIETNDPSRLMACIVDPEGNIRRPMVPMWNGGEIQPIHNWNGGHWEHNFEEYRRTILEPHNDISVSVHNAMEGDWTVIVVPYINEETGYAEFNGEYRINANIRKYSENRINAALSAANGAVIASLNHAPLLYVTEDEVPSETSEILSSLGVNNIIFVNIGEVSSADPGATTELTTLQDVINLIKENSASENFITITSLGTGEGYFAPSGMIAAYHGSPVFNMGEAEEAYNLLDIATAWREYAADHYHGCRTMGHLPQMDHPIDLPNPPSWLQIILYYLTNNNELPPTGLDLELTLMLGINEGVHNLIDSYGLDRNGQESYLFVSPRNTDIRDLIGRAMTGNNSYAGHIMFETPALSSAHICRDILYPAVIYANPGRDVTTSCFMNFRNGNDWTCNDGNRYNDWVTQIMKQSGFSHGRFFEGHTLWSNLLERYNEGCGLVYHCSHGTGGSGICCMYENVEEQFPLNEITHEHLRDFNWFDGWRGFMYDNTKTPSPRLSGLVWVNSEEPNLYDIIHFKWCDQLWDNLHSQFSMWMSCTTAANFGPDIYLEHGSAIYFGNGNTGLSPQSEILDSWMLEDLMINGEGIGEAFSKHVWLHQRDYTTGDLTTIYGPSSMQVSNEQMIFGDPTMTVYSPEWTEPTPIIQ